MSTISHKVVAQGFPKDSLSVLSNSVLAQKQNTLFVHFDKNIYLPNESVWFSAFLFDGLEIQKQANVLSLLLIADDSRQVLARKKFSFSWPISSGEFMIPDSLPAGNYTLMAYLNILHNQSPSFSFRQPITIKDRNNLSTAITMASTTSKVAKNDGLRNANLMLYPEGGELIAHLPCVIGWEVRDDLGKPIETRALILKDGVVVDTTFSTRYGMGSFKLQSIPGSTYELRLTGSKYTGSIDVPAPLERGMAITIPVAVANKVLTVEVAAMRDSVASFVVHNNQRIFQIFHKVKIKNKVALRMVLNEIPKGLTVITALDEHYVPIAERVFFAHYDQGNPLAIQTDSRRYPKRSMVNLKIGLPIEKDSAIVSVAVVHANRINPNHFLDIENFQYLSDEMTFMPWVEPTDVSDEEKSNYLENVLLIRGWRKFIAANQIEHTIIPELKGFVTNFNKALKKPMSLTIMGNLGVALIRTDDKGKFQIANSHLLTDSKNPSLFALEEKESARIHLNDPYLKIDSLMAKTFSLSNRKPILPVNDESIPKTKNAIQLKEVAIKGKLETQYYNIRPGIKTNICGDYVCESGNVLNCPLPGHTIKTKIPIKGNRYNRMTVDGKGMPIRIESFIYQLCELKNKSLVNIDGIYVNKKFYNYSAVDTTFDGAFNNSTLLWKSELVIKPGIPSQLSFFTGDIYGPFKIIVQGITNNGVVSSQSYFEVTQ